MREISYLIFDVFTDQIFAGNPLGVVLDAEGLSGAQMQSIAREFNLSETIFFQKPKSLNHSAKVRIFMPNGELPFAGHPTIGGAIAFAGRHGLGEGAQVVLEEGVGPVTCTVSALPSQGFASFTVPKLSKQDHFQEPVSKVAAALGIEEADVGFAAHKVSLWSAGVPFIMVPVRDVSVLSKLALDAQAWLRMDVVREGKIAAGFVYALDAPGARLTYRARMFAPWDGIAEDPATGSAAAAFSGLVWQSEALSDGRHDVTIHQGVEMKRPSRIGLTLEGANGNLQRAVISGQAVKVAEGTLRLHD